MKNMEISWDLKKNVISKTEKNYNILSRWHVYCKYDFLLLIFFSLKLLFVGVSNLCSYYEWKWKLIDGVGCSAIIPVVYCAWQQVSRYLCLHFV